MKKDTKNSGEAIPHDAKSGANAPKDQDAQNDSAHLADEALDLSNRADRKLAGLLRAIGWQSNADRELSEEEADLILEIAASVPVSDEERRRLREGVLRRRFGTTAVPRQQVGSVRPAEGEDANGDVRSSAFETPTAGVRSLVALLKEHSGLGLREVAKDIGVDPGFLVDISEHPSLVPNGARKEIARRVPATWRISTAETLATFESGRRVPMQKAASRPSAFKALSTTYEDIVKRSKLSDDEKLFWRSFT